MELVIQKRKISVVFYLDESRTFSKTSALATPEQSEANQLGVRVIVLILSDRIDRYGAYALSGGQCRVWNEASINGPKTACLKFNQSSHTTAQGARYDLASCW